MQQFKLKFLTRKINKYDEGVGFLVKDLENNEECVFIPGSSKNSIQKFLDEGVNDLKIEIRPHRNSFITVITKLC